MTRRPAGGPGERGGEVVSFANHSSDPASLPTNFVTRAVRAVMRDD